MTFWEMRDMKRMLLVTALALATVGTSSGCRLFGNRGDNCDPCGYGRIECAPELRGGTTVMPAPAPVRTNLLPEPVPAG